MQHVHHEMTSCHKLEMLSSWTQEVGTNSWRKRSHVSLDIDDVPEDFSCDAIWRITLQQPYAYTYTYSYNSCTYIYIIYIYIYIYILHHTYNILVSYHIMFSHTHTCVYVRYVCHSIFWQKGSCDPGWWSRLRAPNAAPSPWSCWRQLGLTMVERLICMILKGHYFDQTNWTPSIMMIWWMHDEFVSYMCFPCTFGVILAIIRPNWLIRVGGDTTGHALWDKSVPCAPVISERSSLQHLRFRWGKAARRRPSSAGRRWKEARGDSEDRDRRWTQRCSRASPRVPWQLSLW